LDSIEPALQNMWCSAAQDDALQGWRTSGVKPIAPTSAAKLQQQKPFHYPVWEKYESKTHTSCMSGV
jgi:hypothetical protein